MTKIVINTCFGGFSLSQEAQATLHAMGSEFVREMTPLEREESVFYDDDQFLLAYEIPRHDPLLVQVVEQLGSRANGNCAKLAVVEIPGTLYRIREYDGRENVETPEKLDWIDATEAPEPVDWA